MIHTAGLNDNTKAQYNHINKDNGNTKIGDVDVENMQKEKEEERGEKGVKALPDVDRTYSIYITEFSHQTIRELWINLLLEM